MEGSEVAKQLKIDIENDAPVIAIAVGVPIGVPSIVLAEHSPSGLSAKISSDVHREYAHESLSNCITDYTVCIRPTNSGENEKRSLGMCTCQAELLRGVPLSRLLRQGFGPWRQSPSALSEKAKSPLWALSTPVDQIDNFLSHAWRSPGFLKFIQLASRAGALPGTIGALAATLILGMLSLFRVLPPVFMVPSHWKDYDEVGVGFWCSVYAPVVGVLCLVCGAMCPRPCHRDPRLFLDVACICQVDEELKQQGIRALGAFLKHSKKLTIMWSPPYFSRLWCVYELAAFLHINPAGAVQFCPLFMEASFWAVTLLDWLLDVLRYVIGILDPDLESRRASFVCIWIFRLTVGVVFMHVLRRCMAQKRKFGKRLAEFDALAADCQGSTDREFILGSIREWYGSIENFNAQVRGPVRKVVLSTIHGGSLTYRDALFCSFIIQLPTSVDYVAVYLVRGMSPWKAMHISADAFMDVFFGIPFVLKALFLLADKFPARSVSTLSGKLCSLCVSVLITWVSLTVILAGQALRWRYMYDSLQAVGVFLVSAPLTLVAFKGEYS